MRAIPFTAAEVKRLGRAAGFDRVGIAPVGPVEDFAHYREWIDRGFHGTMEYLARGLEPRRDPRSLLPEARAVVVCGLSYLTPHPFSTERQGSDRPIISRYAWGRDYHKVVRERLKRLLRAIEQETGRTVRARLCVDTAPLLERSLAARAGLGWIGKNNALIHPVLGSFVFLGELLIDLELEPDKPMPDRCGTCDLCLEACPTKALVESHALDARRCISYLTIEYRGAVVSGLAAQMGTRVYGCDACQEACPWNQEAQRRIVTTVRDFWPRAPLADATFENLVFDSETAFRQSLTGTAMLRIGWDRWRHNVSIAVRNALAEKNGDRLFISSTSTRHRPHGLGRNK